MACTGTPDTDVRRSWQVAKRQHQIAYQDADETSDSAARLSRPILQKRHRYGYLCARENCDRSKHIGLFRYRQGHRRSG